MRMRGVHCSLHLLPGRSLNSTEASAEQSRPRSVSAGVSVQKRPARTLETITVWPGTMTDVAEWLQAIGLPEYAQRFAENAIDVSVLSDLTDQDLKDLGILLGHRRKMLRAIAELQAAPRTPARTTEPAPPKEAERRHLTLMFCDLVGSTAL